MTNIAEQMKRIRADLNSKETREKEILRARSVKEAEIKRKIPGKIKEGLEIVRQEWTPFLKQLQEEVYGTNMFKELTKFWDKFPTDFTYETSSWRPEPKAYIPVYKSCIYVENGIDSTPQLYLIPEGFMLRVGFCGHAVDKGEFRDVLVEERLLRMGEWENPNILADMRKHHEETTLSLTTPNLEELLKYASPFLLSDSVEFSHTGKLKDILRYNQRVIRTNIKEGIRLAKENYQKRTEELLDCLKKAIKSRYNMSRKE